MAPLVARQGGEVGRACPCSSVVVQGSCLGWRRRGSPKPYSGFLLPSPFLVSYRFRHVDFCDLVIMLQLGGLIEIAASISVVAPRGGAGGAWPWWGVGRWLAGR